MWTSPIVARREPPTVRSDNDRSAVPQLADWIGGEVVDAEDNASDGEDGVAEAVTPSLSKSAATASG